MRYKGTPIKGSIFEILPHHNGKITSRVFFIKNQNVGLRQWDKAHLKPGQYLFFLKRKNSTYYFFSLDINKIVFKHCVNKFKDDFKLIFEPEPRTKIIKSKIVFAGKTYKVSRKVFE